MHSPCKAVPDYKKVQFAIVLVSEKLVHPVTSSDTLR